MLTDRELSTRLEGVEFPIQEVNLTSIVIKWPDPLLTYKVKEWEKTMDLGTELQKVLFQFGLINHFNLN